MEVDYREYFWLFQFVALLTELWMYSHLYGSLHSQFHFTVVLFKKSGYFFSYLLCDSANNLYLYCHCYIFDYTFNNSIYFDIFWLFFFFFFVAGRNILTVTLNEYCTLSIDAEDRREKRNTTTICRVGINDNITGFDENEYQYGARW